MRVLIVSPSYLPEIGAAPSRITNMAEGLSGLGIKVIVKENQLGLVSAPGDYERLSKNIQAMGHLPDVEYRQLKANCLRLSQTTFCFERQLEECVRFLSDL